MKTIVIEIEEQDIRQGVRKDACQCPIALAIRRAVVADIEEQTGNEEPDIEIDVDHDGICFWNHEESDLENEYNLFPVDEEDWYGIKNFMDNFDIGNDVEPFCVELKYN